MKPIVALVGRPNVGKSTLFNRMTRTKSALVDDFPGVTRDRHYGSALWDDTAFTVVDTGGYTDHDEAGFALQIREQVLHAMEDADVIVLVLDGKGGVSPYDQDLTALLRGVAKPVFHVVNKIDGPQRESAMSEFFALGIEEPFTLSAEHGYGFSDFMDALAKALPESPIEEIPGQIKVAVVGRPNVGKSSLINHILGEERLLVSDVAGTTRDSINTEVTADGTSFVLIDTAGIRRKARVSEKIEKYSVIKSLKSLEECDVALIVIDASEGITEQDVNVAGYAYERGCGCIFLLNKWDLVEKDTKTAKAFDEKLADAMKFMSFAPSITISATTGQRVRRIFGMIKTVYEQYETRIGTGQVNKVFEAAVTRNEPPMHKGKRVKYYYATQVGTRPPTFVCFVNYPEALHFSYQRYLMNQVRTQTGLTQTPLKILFRQRTGRIEFGDKKEHLVDHKKDRRKDPQKKKR